jgi:hypothetical protein
MLRNSKLSTLSGSKSGFNDSPDEVYGLSWSKLYERSREVGLSQGDVFHAVATVNTCPLEVGIWRKM